MPDRSPPHPALPRTLGLGLATCLAFAILTAASCSPHFLPGAVVVDHVPPDACVAFYGPGPCREHGSTVVGSTDAVAGPPPASWHGKVQDPRLPGDRP